MPELHELLAQAAPRPTGELDTRRIERKLVRRRRVRRGAISTVLVLVAALTATLIVARQGSSHDDSIDVVTRPSLDERLHTWKVPGIRGTAVSGDEIYVLLQRGEGIGGTWSVGRFDLGTGTVEDPQAVEGSLLSIAGADGYLWIWGQVVDAQLEAALERNDKEAVASGRRLGVVHRISPSGELQTWRLDTVPLFLQARAERAWTATIDFASNEYGLAELGAGEDPRESEPPSPEWGLVLDGDRLWFNGPTELVAIDLESHEVLERLPSRRLFGRTPDGTLWESLAEERVIRFERELPTPELQARRALIARSTDAQIAQLDGGGIVIGRRWFSDPETQQAASAELSDLDAIDLVGPVLDATGDAVLYASWRDRHLNSGDEMLVRWEPRREPPAVDGLPVVEVPTSVSTVCAPYAAGFFTDDVFEWSSQVTTDPDLAGAVRRSGPGGAYVQIYPGHAPWITDAPGVATLPLPDSTGQVHLVRTADGYAAVALPNQSPRAAPCDAITVIGHHLTRPEMLQQVDQLASLLPYSDGILHES
jgi:hypothetical protein